MIMEARRDDNAKMVEDICVTECLELWCATDKLGELWSVESKLQEKGYTQVFECSGIDPRNEIL